MAAKSTRKADPKKSDSGSPHLDKAEQEIADQHSSPRAVVIHEIIREDGEQELTRTVSALSLSGLAAGLSMGFSFLTQALLHASMPDAIWRHAVDSFGYSLGFVFVVLGRQQLFTESTLTAVLPVFTKPDAKNLYKLLRLWLIVLTVNLLGTWLFAAVLLVPSLFPGEVTQSLHALAQSSLNHFFWVTVLKAIMSGWLIALMVWILPSARSARLLTIILITYVVGLAQLPHIVAGSTEAAYAVMSKFSSLGDYFLCFLFPTLLGNTIGGGTLVSLLNHGSIAPEMKGHSHESGDDIDK
jgi:formate/nitrite transporter FocA (FNT family)